MNNMELPIYLVAQGADWMGTEGGFTGSLPAFGTRDDAQSFVNAMARAYGRPTAAYRIVEYKPTGEVFEG